MNTAAPTVVSECNSSNVLYLTCQSPDCEPVASSHILERWVHPNWRRFSGGWSQASERHKVPLERKVGTFLLRGGASAEVKSGRTEASRSTETNLCIDWSNCAAALQRYLCVRVCAQAFSQTSPLPPGCQCAAGISVPPLPPAGRRSYRWAATQPGCLSPGWRCNAGVSDCHSKCDKTVSPVTQTKVVNRKSQEKKGSLPLWLKRPLPEQHNLGSSRMQFPLKVCAVCFILIVGVSTNWVSVRWRIIYF